MLETFIEFVDPRQSMILSGRVKVSSNHVDPRPLTIDKFCWKTLTLRNFGQNLSISGHQILAIEDSL
jgi:hypothetical protein